MDKKKHDTNKRFNIESSKAINIGKSKKKKRTSTLFENIKLNDKEESEK